VETAITPLEITLPTAGTTQHVEIAMEGALVRFEVGADVDYIAALVRRLAARS
jgi:hypothetical protein